MRSIQTTAIVLWVIIFVIAAFILGQFLISKNIFDVTKLFTINEDKEQDESIVDGVEPEDELKNDVVISKVGQETVRIGQNVAEDYFSDYYKEYVNYIMADTDKYKQDKKIAITDDLASDYVFYALSRSMDADKYTSQQTGDKISIPEGDMNSFIDNMFAKKVSETYKEDSNNGYDKKSKVYNIVKNSRPEEYTQELTTIENITSNQVKLEFECKKVVVKDEKTNVLEQKQINIYAVYRGGRYILTDVEKLEKE